MISVLKSSGFFEREDIFVDVPDEIDEEKIESFDFYDNITGEDLLIDPKPSFTKISSKRNIEKKLKKRKRKIANQSKKINRK